jgi:lipopolysaccharide transport system ATP-binding protein
MHTDPYLKEAADGEVLVRVDGVGKKFCRSLKKSLWYGVCDIASELNPFGRVERMPNGYKNLTTIENGGRCENEQLKVGPKGEGVGTTESKDTGSTKVEAKVRLSGQAGAEFSNPSASGLARGSENTSLIRAANNLRS